MAEVIGDILGNAVGVAISPIPIIAVILMLFSSRATGNSISFVLGWVAGLVVAGGLVLVMGLEDAGGGESTVGAWIKVVIGLLFLALAWRNWSSRPQGDEEPAMPAWMATIDDFTSAKSFGLAFLLAAVNPKNLGLTFAAVVKITGAGLSRAQEFGALAVFVAIAAVTVAIPVVASLVLGDKAKGGLDTMKQWLVANNNVVMTVLFVVLGAKVLGDGIAVVL
ncbi:MAG: GAP family protein [Acidimicrobiia bacterium]|nr:GAP family protein [Acidimicrobiia bacterium]